MQSLVADITEGTCCAMCNQQFETEVNKDGADVPTTYTHGYPVACKKCWTPECGFDLALRETFD